MTCNTKAQNENSTLVSQFVEEAHETHLKLDPGHRRQHA